MKETPKIKEMQHLLSLLTLGREYIQDALIRHDSELGRTTMKNESTASSMEYDISEFNDAIQKLHNKIYLK
jgi:hypothetical protein